MGKTYSVCEKCGQMNRVDLNTNKSAVCGSCKTELPVYGALIDGSDKTFQKLIAKSPLPVVVDVWAQWCGPCRSFAPTFKEASENFAGKIVFVKLDSDKNQQSAGQLGIRSIPTILIFRDGVEIARQSGAIPSEQFAHWLEQSIR
ncbi:MAG: thioredoxin TrxC [Bdellovibrionaceae bacterium]|nr:thioredoxin TrxC [Pseudobdellovibrionaceae bacterium]